METAIEVHDLQMRYGDNDVLLGVDFEVHTDEVVCLLGPNGAGKTTTIEILEGFRIRSGGHVDVLGQDPAHADDGWRSRTGVVLQSWRDHPRWTPRRLLTLLGSYFEPYSTPERPRPYRVDELLDTVGLTDFADRKLNALSGGQRRRLDVAVGIVGRPELLFLDEPTSGFDPQARREFHQLVQRLAGLEHTTVLLTTHDLDEAEKLADRVLVLAGGRIVADDTPDGLSRRVAGEAEVQWSVDGERFVRKTDDPTGFVRHLFAQDGEAVRDLDIRRASLEDAYLSLVQQHESGQVDEAAQMFKDVTR